jgi:hypothetical protein
VSSSSLPSLLCVTPSCPRWLVPVAGTVLRCPDCRQSTMPGVIDLPGGYSARLTAAREWLVCDEHGEHVDTVFTPAAAAAVAELESARVRARGRFPGARPGVPVAAWAAPSWAEHSSGSETGAVLHSWVHPAEVEVAAFRDGALSGRVQVELAQYDMVRVSGSGVTVLRGAPEIYCEGLVLTAESALQLAEVLRQTCAVLGGAA